MIHLYLWYCIINDFVSNWLIHLSHWYWIITAGYVTSWLIHLYLWYCIIKGFVTFICSILYHRVCDELVVPLICLILYHDMVYNTSVDTFICLILYHYRACNTLHITHLTSYRCRVCDEFPQARKQSYPPPCSRELHQCHDHE